MRTYWLESEQNDLVNRYRFLNKKPDDDLFEMDSRLDTKEETQISNRLCLDVNDNSEYQNPNEANCSTSNGRDTVIGNESEMNDHMIEQMIPLLRTSSITKSAST